MRTYLNRIAEGGEAAAAIMAKDLGTRIHLNSPVTAIDHSGDKITVETGDQKFIADDVIVTGSPLGVRYFQKFLTDYVFVNNPIPKPRSKMPTDELLLFKYSIRIFYSPL